ncbi:hypothetical protein LT679_15325 [Mucilaginibacter roseus]|uniref:Carbohydrate-binding domain-containing protein n=1 Tax=Mucilaginibacter roseus TaxID=1528868 RepID=A0ABS8U7U6_9SPHI|nr:carbohydrate-binding family 9-like protein [Mucilaginibacter roseus]MCD8741984.1 hypothetical protein [Mucilaginibacter roseus]
MSIMNIPYIPSGVLGRYSFMDDASVVLDSFPAAHLHPTSWCTAAQHVSARFALAYDRENIYIKYYVNEPVVKAFYLSPNDPVYNDSCVELFIAFDDDINYYNLEFNCAGTCLGQYGSDRDNREFLPAAMLHEIKHVTTLRSVSGRGVAWEMTVAIPLRVFAFHPQLALSGTSARINAYKCGDGLDEPHYLCWNQVKSDVPDFHRYDSFNGVMFTLSEEFSVD